MDMIVAMSTEKIKKSVSMYIDGFNLYHAIVGLNRNDLKWLNPITLAQSFLKVDEKLFEVHFFTAVLTWNPEKQKRHINYLAALRAVGVVVHESNFKKTTKYCREADRYCSFREEKQTDVSFALQVVRDAYEGAIDRAILVTADSDQIPIAKFLNEKFSQIKLTLAAPPGRLQEARDLGNYILNRTEIKAGRLATCRLPRDVMDSSGKKVATMPAQYARPSDIYRTD